MSGPSADLRKRLAAMYEAGKSIPQISGKTGINRSRVRSELLKAGVRMRTTSEALRIREGLGDHLRGKPRLVTDEGRKNIAAGRRKWGEENAAGVSHKASGYVEITRGENKGRSVHVVAMEERLGRRLLSDEVVHHIDRDRSNNDPNNLALMTRSGHTRLHRYEDSLAGIERKRVNGRFC